MRVGIVQPIAVAVGGNEKVLSSLLHLFKNDDVTLFTFSKPEKDYPGITVKTKIPFKIPFLGLYQRLLVQSHDYSNCDLIISTSGRYIKTDKPVIVYDQNNISAERNVELPQKYKKGFWKLYYLPYKLLVGKINQSANMSYVAASDFCAVNLEKIIGEKPSIIYPAVDLGEFYSLDKLQQICVIGRISPEKNLEQTISILNRVDYPCFIFGNVTTANQNYLKKLRSLAGDNITFMINRPRNELLELMALSKIIFTASKETFGIATVEGIASGCIPIVPDNSAHPETVPIPYYRYQNDIEAVQIINYTMDDTNEENLEKLQEHIMKFSHENFERDFLNTVKSVMI